MQKPVLNIICGPTSSGKTSLAIQLCKRFNGVIISADARQVFKHMDIGTGKIPSRDEYEVEKANTKWKIDNIDVFGYDLATPDMYFSAYNWATYAVSKIKQLMSKTNKKIFVVGGTGFYIDVLTGKKTLAQIEINKELRHELQKRTTNELAHTLTSLNPSKANNVDLQNKVRLIRAIEIEKSPKTNATKKSPLLPDYQYNYIGLTGDRTLLYSKADNWLDHIWENGLLQETKNLLKNYPNSKNLTGIIYKSATQALSNPHKHETLRQEAKYDLHKYIRRQLTWFRKNKEINWLDTNDENLILSASNLVK